MKVLFPRNIEKWIIAWLSFNIGPFRITLIQLILLAIWAAWTLAVINWLLKNWFNTVIAVIFWSPIFFVFFVIAFFKISELSLIPFIAKMLRTHFFDVTKKYQCNFPKINKTEIILHKRKYQDKKEEIKQKYTNVNQELLDKMENDSLV